MTYPGDQQILPSVKNNPTPVSTRSQLQGECYKVQGGGVYKVQGGDGYKVIQVDGYKVRQVGGYKVSLLIDPPCTKKLNLRVFRTKNVFCAKVGLVEQFKILAHDIFFRPQYV